MYTLRASRGEGSRENCAAHVSPPHLSPRTDSSHFSHSASAPSLSLGFPHSPLPPPPPRVPTRGQLTFPQLWQLQLLASLPPQPSPPPSDCHSCLLLFPALFRSSRAPPHPGPGQPSPPGTMTQGRRAPSGSPEVAVPGLASAAQRPPCEKLRTRSCHGLVMLHRHKLLVSGSLYYFIFFQNEITNRETHQLCSRKW